MKKLYIKQKVWGVGEKFTVMDEDRHPNYYVEGSFLKLPKEFRIKNNYGRQIGTITKKVFSMLPKFYIEVSGKEPMILEKEFTLFKAKYLVVSKGIRIEGNLWDMNFSVYTCGKQVATIAKRWLSWGDAYEVTILDETMEEIVVALVVAIDCVKAEENAAANTASDSYMY